MSWGAVAGAGISLVGGYLSSKNNSKANNSAASAQEAAYYANSQNLQPYMNAGNSALSQLQQLNSGNYSSFTESPDYQFSLTQGLQGLDRSAAARGALYSGGQTADVLNYASGLASQNYNDYYNKIANLANTGLGAASALTGVNQNYANSQTTSAYNNAANQNSLIGLLSGVGSNLASNYLSSRGSSYGGLSNQANAATQASNYNLLQQAGLG